MSTATTSGDPVIRPKKPRKDFPLFLHGNGQWAKKVRGRLRYFGIWADPDAAERRWYAQREDLLAGRPLRPVGPDELLVKDICNRFLTRKKAAADAGEITERAFLEYLAACQRFARVTGSATAVSHLVPEDFAKVRNDMRKTLGPVRLCVEIQRIRCLFNFGVSQRLITCLPVYGDGFKKPSRKTLRKHRADRGLKMFEAEQVRDLLLKAGPTLRAMILLALNCGYGNTDVGQLERRRLDLKTGWADFPRPKTGVARRCPLWPETVKAIRKILKARDRRLKDQADAAEQTKETAPIGKRYRRLVFLTKYGRPWRSRTGNPISEKFGRLVRRLGLHRPGLGFYALRHTFETIAGDTKDQLAVSAIMGHAAKSDDMSAVYRERIDEARLQAVTEYVRKWLFGEETKQPAKTG